MARRRNKGEEKRIVQQRLDILLRRAREEALGPDADLAHRHGGTIRRIARRYQVTFTPEQKAHLCRKCGAYRTSTTSRVRIHRGRITTTCLRCGHRHRRPL